MNKRSLPVLLAASGLVVGFAQAGPRWYDAKQVQQGAKVFAKHCTSCHGANAQGLAEDWKRPGPDGKYPPPPLDGSAHAWHHPLSVLRTAILDGGIPLGGVMPPFKEKLSGEEIDAAIAFFQSRWRDETYNRWQERNNTAAGLLDTTRATALPKTQEPGVTIQPR